uniref:Kinesin motor domain-containing protein n=1 Tax=Heterorhabditis bacteriophora TaxID=37862 RepID=A0A1I7W6Y2_HETBA
MALVYNEHIKDMFSGTQSASMMSGGSGGSQSYVILIFLKFTSVIDCTSVFSF